MALTQGPSARHVQRDVVGLAGFRHLRRHPKSALVPVDGVARPEGVARPRQTQTSTQELYNEAVGYLAAYLVDFEYRFIFICSSVSISRWEKYTNIK